MSSLTAKQDRLLKLISELTVGRVSPTFQMLADGLGTSKGNIHDMLVRLRERGEVTWDSSPRSIRLKDPLAAQPTSKLVAMRDRIDALLVERMV